MMKHRSVVAFAVIVVAVGACAPGIGAPSILGPTGALLTPNAEVVGRGAVDVGAHFGDGQVPFFGDAEVALYKANVGLTKRLEVSGTFVSISSNAPDEVVLTGAGVRPRQDGVASTDDDELIFHAKYQLSPASDDGVNVAVGVLDMLEDALSNRVWYGAATRTVGKEAGERLVRGTGGVALGNDIGGDGDDLELFASVEAELTDRLMGLAEFFGDDVSFGGRFLLGDRFNVDLASVEFDGAREFMAGAGFHASW